MGIQVYFAMLKIYLPDERYSDCRFHTSSPLLPFKLAGNVDVVPG